MDAGSVDNTATATGTPPTGATVHLGARLDEHADLDGRRR